MCGKATYDNVLLECSRLGNGQSCASAGPRSHRLRRCRALRQEVHAQLLLSHDEEVMLAALAKTHPTTSFEAQVRRPSPSNAAGNSCVSQYGIIACKPHQGQRFACAHGEGQKRFQALVQVGGSPLNGYVNAGSTSRDRRRGDVLGQKSRLSMLSWVSCRLWPSGQRTHGARHKLRRPLR